ncbi:hypothetical protein B0T19DRAFT_455562 [Cercophora scortea]|uniref:Uncharacterized protein n=1 Tax=Cercophora scortea TaxID=314031 RepID=A0AAE0MMK8_9PEZI|nr:hypothetical protein B0T19DRAFT_455562 [Cercophora scortea]
MARIFITGSSDGLGLQTAKQLIQRGHSVVLHARSPQRARDASAACPGNTAVLTGDLRSIPETTALAAAANAHGPYDAVIHNAGGLLRPDPGPPKRRVHVSSGLHFSGSYPPRSGSGGIVESSYGDTKLHNVMLAKTFARRWQGEGVQCYAADPGWVPTKMGGRAATGRMEDGVATFVMLALGEHVEGKGEAAVSGGYFANSKEGRVAYAAGDEAMQDQLLAELATISGVALPGTAE